MNKKNTLKSVDRALKTLCILGNSSEPITIQSLSKALNLPRTTIYATINSLERYGFISKNKMTKTIDLGWRLYSLGNNFVTKQLPITAQEETDILLRKWNLTVQVGIYARDNKVVFIISKLPNKPYEPFMTFPHPGLITEAHHTSSGKVLLAHLKSEDLKWLNNTKTLSSKTSRTITDPKKLLAELENIRREGLAFDDEESVSGIFCIAAPIVNYLGECIASVSVAGPKNIMIDNLEVIKKDVQLTANNISEPSMIRKS